VPQLPLPPASDPTFVRRAITPPGAWPQATHRSRASSRPKGPGRRGAFAPCTQGDRRARRGAAASCRTVLDELPRRTGGEQGRAFSFPGRADRVTEGNGVRVAAFGIGVQRGRHCKIKIAKLPRFEVAGSVGGCWRLREPPPPGALHHVSSYTSGGPRACSPARLVRRECEGRCGPPSTDPPASQVPRRSNRSSPRGEPTCSPAHVPTPVVEWRARDSGRPGSPCHRRCKVEDARSRYCRLLIALGRQRAIPPYAAVGPRLDGLFTGAGNESRRECRDPVRPYESLKASIARLSDEVVKDAAPVAIRRRSDRIARF
jgi:hypothetical protein